MEEIWKDVVGYENLYQVSNLGNVKSIDRKINIKGKNQFKEFNSYKIIKGKIINKAISTKGYYQVCLYKNNIRKNMLVHRLVAEAFIENKDNKETVNHIDGNTLNNTIKNLEWATFKEQQLHRNYILRHKSVISDECRKKQKELHERKVIRSDGKIFNSIKIASNGNETLRKNINKCCKGKQKTAGGYKWEYLEKGE